ncbi:RimJ/RimL family protein N-acetyltransferase [Streptacidiphilus sp. MAP12-33]|uniref:GNAT family N-acetyltransferase n=1 Tax=Streptacidiphilus sp. MAP12-33 TaxID=3156266 RepID=UPI0035146851
MLFRPTTASDLDRILPLMVADPASRMTPENYRARLATGEYRPARTWLAEDSPDTAPLAVAVWWGDEDDDHPRALDALLVSDASAAVDARITLAADLLTAAHAAFAQGGTAEPAAFHLFLPGDWRERPDVVAALTWRQEAARRAGLGVTLERLRYEWTPGDGPAQPTGRLTFHPEPDDEVFVQLFRRVLEGTLDTGSRKDADRIGAEAQAREDVAFYREQMRGERAWWRVARTPDGEPVGFGLPSANPGGPVVGYLGVLPEHRGQGHVDEILAEITRILAVEAEAQLIRADTDLTNTPMAAAFLRLGYRNASRRLVLSAT